MEINDKKVIVLERIGNSSKSELKEEARKWKREVDKKISIWEDYSKRRAAK